MQQGSNWEDKRQKYKDCSVFPCINFVLLIVSNHPGNCRRSGFGGLSISSHCWGSGYVGDMTTLQTKILGDTSDYIIKYIYFHFFSMV